MYVRGQGLVVLAVGPRAVGQLFSWPYKEDFKSLCGCPCMLILMSQRAEHHNEEQTVQTLLLFACIKVKLEKKKEERVGKYTEGGLWLQETEITLSRKCQHAKRQLRLIAA